jgi:MYXO-CTERM domain-containing protein
MNFGDCCASVIGGYVHSETHPYVSGKNYKAAVAFAPDIVVIGSWGRHDWGKSAMTALASFSVPAFQTGYEDIIMKFQALPSKPKIFASTLIPIPGGMDGPDNGYKTSPQSDVVTMLATKYSLPTVDLFTAFTGHPELFIQPPMKDSDGEHTSDAGSTKIAQLVAAAITGTPVTPTPAGDAGVPATGSGGSKAGGPGAGGAKGPPAGGSGGATGTGGVDASGGAAPGGGPTTGTGGAIVFGSGGAPVVVSGSGGATVVFTSGGAIGSFGTGGAVGAAGETGAAATPSSSSSGCACSMDAGSSGSPRGAGLLASAALVGLGLVLRRKRLR